MELLKEIASVAGKPGLFKILKPTRNGVILETIDEKKTKLVANSNERVSILKEISVYTTTAENSIALEDVLRAINKKYGKDISVDPKSSDADLRRFMESVLPEYDDERVYCSDIKKLIKWYSVLSENFPDLFTASSSKENTSSEEVKAEAEEKPKAKTTKAKAAETDSTEEKPKKTTKAKKAE